MCGTSVRSSSSHGIGTRSSATMQVGHCARFGIWRGQHQERDKRKKGARSSTAQVLSVLGVAEDFLFRIANVGGVDESSNMPDDELQKLVAQESRGTGDRNRERTT